MLLLWIECSDKDFLMMGQNCRNNRQCQFILVKYTLVYILTKEIKISPNTYTMTSFKLLYQISDGTSVLYPYNAFKHYPRLW